ncbi:hypothetical protein [Demequina maris]|uniref:hypothetical protein n=1 Tax=Demequina maris TaxID=1638982 RepID=UPI0007862693|nr:hypothetical protein [Demequina maris]
MKGLRAPVGNQPSEVYWRRRIVLLVALAVIVALGWLIVSALSSDGAEPTASSTPTTSTAPTSSTSPSPSVSQSESAASDDVTACVDGAISVSVAPNPASVPADKQPRFDVTIEQDGDVPCVIDATGKDTKLVITSGDDRIWSSNDCPAEEALIGKSWLLDAGDTKDVQVAWPRIRSAEGCAAVDQAPGAGTYWATVTVAGVKADAVPFVLE